ncbi:MAG: binding-protein-dependent transport system inner rane component [Eubacterium sp.]|jgi:putative aldouronate transport system permease protein|nr:binding-protein-dependent transport system inner rane component [Eubacterium sp.]
MMKIKKSVGSTVFDTINIVIMLAICFAALYPIWYVLIHSLNNGFDSAQGGLYWWPREFTWDNYKEVFRNSEIITAFLITIARTVIATAAHVFFTAMVAYAFLNRELIGRKVFMTMGLITMFFSGGLIPTFIVIKTLGMFDKFIVYIFPVMFSFFDLIIFQAFFRTIPEALEESAKMDGANHFTIFLKITLPLSKAVIATILLFNGVFNWNDYFMGIIYTNNQDLHPIQTYLYKIIMTSDSSKTSLMAGSVSMTNFTSTSLQMATMIITTIPIVCIYPFLQKHFVKGMLIGSVKE